MLLTDMAPSWAQGAPTTLSRVYQDTGHHSGGLRHTSYLDDSASSPKRKEAELVVELVAVVSER